jgi:hypothetical protein
MIVDFAVTVRVAVLYQFISIALAEWMVRELIEVLADIVRGDFTLVWVEVLKECLEAIGAFLGRFCNGAWMFGHGKTVFGRSLLLGI